MLLSELVFDSVVSLVRDVQTRLPDDVTLKLREIYEQCQDDLCRTALLTMLRNVELAKEECKPICQDTGTPKFIVRLGDEFPIRSRIVDIITKAFVEATQKIPLRPNAVDPVTNRNTGTGVGRGVPIFEVELVEGDYVEIFYIARGGGCELPTRVFSTIPEEGWDKVKKAVTKLVRRYGRFACPPLVIGVGIGATCSLAVKVAERALYLRKIGERHPDKKIAKLEEELMKILNELEVGVQGLKVGPTVLDVHIDYACRHPATFAIAVVFSCWVMRRGGIRITASGQVQRIL